MASMALLLPKKRQPSTLKSSKSLPNRCQVWHLCSRDRDKMITSVVKVTAELFWRGFTVCIYQEHGYNNRLEYLKDVAAMYSVDEDMVFAVASILGPNEDFDGLINAVEDDMMLGW